MPIGLKRVYGRGDLHFITFSCYRRLPLLASPQARGVFVHVLDRVRNEYGFKLVGYVVMPEHVHLLMTEPPRGGPSTVLKMLKQRVSHELRKKRSALTRQESRSGSSECSLGRQHLNTSTTSLASYVWCPHSC
ncbi:MAG: transposase [Candidatus Acidiferrales bacterium]